LSERTKDGLISNIDFRNAFKQLNLGITTKEIDELLSYCDINKDGFINWKEFEKKFNISEVNQRIIERSKNKLKTIKNDIYSYMISPKDAFRLYNEE